jgi:hypothetical protein
MTAQIIHEDVVRFESGGTINLVKTSGGDDYTVYNVVPGSLSFEPPMSQQGLDYTDRGVQQARLQGDDGLGSLSFRTRGTKFDALGLMTILSAANTTANTMTEWTVTIKVPNFRGASGASAATVTVLVASRNKVDFKAGTDFDEVGVEMSVRSWTAPVAGAYP